MIFTQIFHTILWSRHRHVHIYSCRKTLRQKSSANWTWRIRDARGRKAARCGKIPVVEIFQTDTKAQLRILEGHKSLASCKMGKTKKNILAAPTITLQGIGILVASAQLFKNMIMFAVRQATLQTRYVDNWRYGWRINLWDIRSSQVQWSPWSMGPCECCTMYAWRRFALTAGGNEIKVWDILGGGRLVRTCRITETITSLCLDGTENRILSAGLDGHVKIYTKHVKSHMD